MPSSRPRGSAAGAHQTPRVSTAPMSERQQMALVMQLTSQSQGTSNANHSVSKSRDRNERGETALHVAAIKGDHEQVKKLIDQGIDPNVTDFAGWTPLHEACSYGWHNIAVILVQAGGNVNARGLDDDTPLHDAANNGHLKLVKFLVQCGANPYFKNKKGKTPFDVARSPSTSEYLTSLKDNSSSSRIPHAQKSRDDTKKGSTGEDSSLSGSCSTAMMDSGSKSDEKNDSKDSSTSSDKPSNSAFPKNEDETSGSLNVATATTTHEETTTSPNQGSKRAFSDISDVTETDNVEDEGTKRKKRKDSDSSKESSKGSQQSRVSVGRNNLAAGCKPPGPASKTGVTPLNKGSGLSQGGSSKAGGGNTGQNKSSSGTHQSNQSKNSGNASCKGTIGSGQNSSQSGKSGSGGQGKSQNSNLMVAQSSKTGSDKKSPCASPKPASFNQSKDESEVEEKTVDTPGPKVPPLKIVIPGGVSGSGGSGGQQEGEGGSTQRGNAKNRGGNSTLPYILQPSSSSNDNSGTETNESNNESTKEDKRSSNNSSDEKSGVSGQRVLRSHRNADGTEKDKDRGRNSPQVSQSSNSSPSGGSISTKTPPSQSGDNNENSSSSGGSGSGSGGQGNAGGSGGSQSTSGGSQAMWDGVFQVPSVDFHPRKRKIKSSKDSHSHHQSSAPDSSLQSSSSSGDSHTTHINPQSNSYQMYINVKKQIERRQKFLFAIQPKPPQGFKDYLMNRCTYVLKSNAKQQPVLKPSQSLPPQMREEFILQENERHYLRVQHLVEKEKLVLAVEQEILRVHGRAARALANQALPFSVCSVLRDKEVYNMLTPEQEEKERNAQRSRYNGRLFLSWLQDVDDKWEKIKESMVKRHHTEAESLYASQTMSWGWRLQELGLCDHKSPPTIDQGHVPKVNVSDDFDLSPA